MTPSTSHRTAAQRSRAPSLLALLVAAVVALPVAAAEEDFALAFAVEPPAGETLFAIELPPAVYATLVSPDLADLTVVDAQGREQPLSLLRPAPPAVLPPEQIPLALPIALPADAAASPGALALHVLRDGDGRLRAVDLESVDAAAAEASPSEWWVDLGDTARQGIDGLRLTTFDDADFRVTVDVRASDDLVRWETLQTALPLVRASQGGHTIERLDLRFARTTRRYVALEAVSEGQGLPALRALVGLRHRGPAPTPLSTLVLTPIKVSTDGRTAEYGRPGPLPVHQLDVQLASGDGLLDYTVEQAEGERWESRAGGTAWRLSVGGETLTSEPVDAVWSSAGTLRLRFAQAPAAPPSLVLGYRPDHAVVLANGTPPFRLLAGSAQATGGRATLADTLAVVRDRQGAEWQPPLARLGPPEALAGRGALTPRPDAGKISLWLVLALGAAAVAFMAIRLLRQSGPGPTPSEK